MRTDTKARAIPKKVKEIVAERDSCDGWPCCINCGRPAPPSNHLAFSNAHFVSRAQGGLGTTPENILTLCDECHRKYDQTTARSGLREYFRSYLQSKYQGWEEEKLIYKKDR